MARRTINTPKRSGQLTPKSKVKIPNLRHSNPQAYGNRPSRPGTKTPDGEKRKLSTVTFARLFANASVTDAKYAPDVHILKIRPYAAKDGFGVRTITLDEKPPRKWNQIVIAQDGLPIYKTKHIWCSCSCPRWMFYWEYAASLRNATDIIYGNGDPPVFTNPSSRVSSCKHILTILRWCRVNRK